MNTNWSKPTRNVFKAIHQLRNALAAGYRAKLIRLRNQDCMHPIRNKKANTDFRNYEFQIGLTKSYQGIIDDPDMSCFEKHLSLNYITRYGSQDAVEQYYSTGQLTADNDMGMGRSHLVHIQDYIDYLKDSNQHQWASQFSRHYNPANAYTGEVHWFCFYRYKHGSPYTIRNFRFKLWVVELLKTES